MASIYYTEVDLSPYEVPNEQSLCIYISGCQQVCQNCHYPDLRKANYGEPLIDFFEKLLELYFYQATCVCFFGEGENTPQSRRELTIFAKHASKMGKRVCLYSGRDIEPENWMNVFDYIKVGSYQQFLGSLDSPSTNQVFYRKNVDGIYENITYTFWLREMVL